jgi:hypothetical protein
MLKARTNVGHYCTARRRVGGSCVNHCVREIRCHRQRLLAEVLATTTTPTKTVEREHARDKPQPRAQSVLWAPRALFNGQHGHCYMVFRKVLGLWCAQREQTTKQTHKQTAVTYPPRIVVSVEERGKRGSHCPSERVTRESELARCTHAADQRK